MGHSSGPSSPCMLQPKTELLNSLIWTFISLHVAAQYRAPQFNHLDPISVHVAAQNRAPQFTHLDLHLLVCCSTKQSSSFQSSDLHLLVCCSTKAELLNSI